MKIRSSWLLSVILTLAMLIGMAWYAPLTAAPGDAITMVFTIDQLSCTIDGVATAIDVSPVIIEGRTMLPIRFVADPLGASVGWDPETSKVTIQLFDTKLELWIGQSNAMLNGKPLPIDATNPNVKPLIINGRTMLPLRFVSENLGCDLNWDGATQQVTLKSAAEEPQATLETPLPTTPVTSPATAPATTPTSDLDEEMAAYIAENFTIDPDALEEDAALHQPVAPIEAGDPSAQDSQEPTFVASSFVNEPIISLIESEPTVREVTYMANLASYLLSLGIDDSSQILLSGATLDSGVSASQLNLGYSSTIQNLFGLKDPEIPVGDQSQRPKPISNLTIVSNAAQPKPLLTWKDNADNETEYTVYREELARYPDSDYVQPINGKEYVLPANSTSFIDTDAIAGKEYRYNVQPRNAAGRAEHSSGQEISVKAYGTPPPPPLSPTNLEIVSGPTQPAPRLTWKDNATDETEYKVTRIDFFVSPAVSKTYSLPANSTSFTDTDAVAGKKYYYSVEAIRNLEYSVVRSGSEKYHRVYRAGNGNLTDLSDKGLEFIGYGYDILGDYASPASVKVPVLDTKKMVEWRQLNRTPSYSIDNYDENISRSAWDYMEYSSKKINVSGGFMGFGASVETNFSSTVKTGGSKYLATITYWVRLHEYKIADPLSFDAANFILPSVLDNLNSTSITPAQILDNYGSHILTSVHIGGRLNYNVSMESSYAMSFTSFQRNVQASFNSDFANLGLSVGDGSKSSGAFTGSNAQRKVLCLGGTLNAAGLMDVDYAVASYNDWRKSLDEPYGTPTLCDFGSQEMIPIWTLCTNPNRANAIKSEFIKRANAQEKYASPSYVTNLSFQASNIGPNGWVIAGNIRHAIPMYMFYELRSGLSQNSYFTDLFVEFIPKSQSIPDYINPATWNTTHNGNYTTWERRSQNIYYDIQQIMGYTYYPGACCVYAARGTGSVEKLPIKEIEIIRIPKGTIEAKMVAEPDWEYVCRRNTDTPFNFIQTAPGVTYHGNDSIYIRFLRG